MRSPTIAMATKAFRPSWQQSMLRIRDPKKSLPFYQDRLGMTLLHSLDFLQWSFSLYFLVLFYKATEERLAPFNPFYKFVTVKAILFFSFWQSCMF